MTTRTATRTAPADASVLAGVRGCPWWGAVAIALVLTVAGAGVDALASGVLGWGIRLGFGIGVVLAALAVRRGSVFTAMVQPPLVVVAGILIGSFLFISGGGLYSTAIKIVGAFPTMLVGTVAAVALGIIRIVAQPLRPAGHLHRAAV